MAKTVADKIREENPIFRNVTTNDIMPAVGRVNGEAVLCNTITCEYCDFHTAKICDHEIMEWLNSELPE